MAIFSGIGLSRVKNKLGSMVLLSRAGGVVVAREYVSDVKNPRTAAQMKRRTRWANLVNFYRLSKGWMAMAFENKKANQSDYNKFMSLNINKADVYLTKEAAAMGGVVMGNLIVSYGSLRSIAQRVENGVGISDLCTGSLVVTAATTIADLSNALLQNTPSLRDGDQISFISYLESFEDGVPRSTCRAFELPVDTSRTDELISDYWPDFLCKSQADGGKQVLINAEVPAGAFTWILSRTISGKTYVSTQSLVVKSTINLMFTSPAARKRAIDSYGESGTKFLDSNTYASNEPASIPGIITRVYSAGSDKYYSQGDVMIVSEINDDPLTIETEGIDTSSITRVRVITNEGRIFEVGVSSGDVGENSIGSLSLPSEMGGTNAYVKTVSILNGTTVVATATFSSPQGGEME